MFFFLCQAELAVHKKKIEEVESWLRVNLDKSKKVWQVWNVCWVTCLLNHLGIVSYSVLYSWLWLHRVAPFCCSLAPQDVGRPQLFESLPRIWVFRSKSGQIPPPPLSTKLRICSRKALIQVRSRLLTMFMLWHHHTLYQVNDNYLAPLFLSHIRIIYGWSNFSLSVYYGMFLSYSSDLFLLTDSRFNSFHGSSQTGLFQEFLLRANKYNRLQMSGEKETEDRKIIFIEVLHRTAL